jgi:hypothetical protein
MNIELMKKLYVMSQKDSKNLIYIDDNERTNFARILKGEKDQYYYQFIHDADDTVRNLADISEDQVAVYTMKEDWTK